MPYIGSHEVFFYFLLEVVTKCLNVCSILIIIILHRWTMNARSELDRRAIPFKVVLVKLMEMTKFGSLISDFNKLNTVPLSSLAMSSNDTEYTPFASHPPF